MSKVTTFLRYQLIMRLELDLVNEDSKQNVLPINYQYELSAAIYKIIHQGNPKFAKWLHDGGYSNGQKLFKLFSFSHLLIAPGGLSVEKDRL